MTAVLRRKTVILTQPQQFTATKAPTDEYDSQDDSSAQSSVRNASQHDSMQQQDTVLDLQVPQTIDLSTLLQAPATPVAVAVPDEDLLAAALLRRKTVVVE